MINKSYVTFAVFICQTKVHSLLSYVLSAGSLCSCCIYIYVYGWVSIFCRVWLLDILRQYDMIPYWYSFVITNCQITECYSVLSYYLPVKLKAPYYITDLRSFHKTFLLRQEWKTCHFLRAGMFSQTYYHSYARLVECMFCQALCTNPYTLAHDGTRQHKGHIHTRR